MNSASVDLIYLDPPFNSKANYAAPIGSKAAGAAFKDTWTLRDVDVEWINLIEAKHAALYRVLLAAMTPSDKSYLVYMAARLLEMKRLLRATGSIYLHCDPTMSHYLKLRHCSREHPFPSSVGCATLGNEAKARGAVEQAGEYRIGAPREQVWEALNDPAVLARCLDGCRSLVATGANKFAAEIGAKVGPVKATFAAVIVLSDVVRPESYRLAVRVHGAAGFANGSARVALEATAPQETLLRYRIEGAIGGKLAQLGSRLVSGAARKMTVRFFERFRADFDRGVREGTAKGGH